MLKLGKNLARDFFMVYLKNDMDIFPEVKQLIIDQGNLHEKMNMDVEEAGMILTSGIDFYLTGDTIDNFIEERIMDFTNTGSAYASKRPDHHYESFDEDALHEGLKTIFLQTSYAQRVTKKLPIPPVSM